MAIAEEAPHVALRGGDKMHRLSVEQYERMAALGILAEKDPVVLLDGLLVTTMTKGPRHSVATICSQKALESVLPAGWHVRVEQPIVLRGGPEGMDSVPEPDLAVVRGAARDYLAEHPGPADLALVVEVADSSLEDDRAGLARYARALIPAAWIVNLVERVVEVYSDPSGPVEAPRYRTARTFGEGEAVPVVVAGAEVGRVAVRDLLP